MILRYKGYWVKINKEKWKTKTFKEKWDFVKDYFSEQRKYIFDQLKDYWIGYVDVHTQDIWCGGCGTDEPSHKELYGISIICGKHGDGQIFPQIGKSIVEQIVRDWEVSEEKKFQLHLDLGGGASQKYTFSKQQKDMLVEKLKPLIDMKWYDGDRENDG